MASGSEMCKKCRDEKSKHGRKSREGIRKFVQNLFKRQLAEIYLRLKPSMVIRQIIMHVQQRQRRSMKTIHVRSLKHILKTSAGMTIFSFVVRAGVEHIQWQYFR